MPLPEINSDGFLPPGIHAASLRETLARFGVSSPARQQKGELLRLVVEAAQSYPTIKRVLVWGSFVTAKPEPNDLDYSVVVSVYHPRAVIAPQHRRFFLPAEARQFYGVDKAYLELGDYPLITYTEQLIFLCETRRHQPCGIIEISLRGETAGEHQ